LAIQEWVADGVDRAAEALTETHAVDTEITALETLCCALRDFGSDPSHGRGDELVAGVLLPFRGTLTGAGLLSMDPEDALAWAHSDGSCEDPIETILELGTRMLSAVIESASAALQAPTEIGKAKLEESSLAGCLLSTHAPSDTVLIRTRIEITAGHQSQHANLSLLMEPKVVSALLGALSVSMN
jgi:hypothetical protein